AALECQQFVDRCLNRLARPGGANPQEHLQGLVLTGGTMRTAERRGRRNDADGGTTRTAARRGRRNDADGGTTRTAGRRGRRNGGARGGHGTVAVCTWTLSWGDNGERIYPAGALLDTI